MQQRKQLLPPFSAEGQQGSVLLGHLRPVILLLFLVGATVFALPGLLAALVIWYILDTAQDYQECWRWIYAGTVLGGICYLTWMVVVAPFPGFFTLLFEEFALRLWYVVAVQIVLLWLTNLMLTPFFVLVMAYFSPPHRSILPVLKEEPTFVVESREEGKAYEVQEAFTSYEPEDASLFGERGVMVGGITLTQRFLLLLAGSWLLELFMGAVFMQWYWGTPWLGGQVSLDQFICNVFNTYPRFQSVTSGSIFLGVLCVYLLIHVAYAVWYGILGPLVVRWKSGIRPPSFREQEHMRDALVALSLTGCLVHMPKRWGIAEGLGLQTRWVGYMLVVDRELINHRYFLPLLANALYACNSEIRTAQRFYEMLPRVEAVLGVIGGFPFAIGHALLYWWWMQYWHQSVFDADRYACDLGQGFALVQALDELYLRLDQATPGGRKLRKMPYIEERIDRLRRYLGI